MWWDGLIPHHPDPIGYEPRFTDAAFKVLGNQLELPSRDCQLSALHGLGHLQHPHTKQAITHYLARRGGADPELRQYAEACPRGEIL